MKDTQEMKTAQKKPRRSRWTIRLSLFSFILLVMLAAAAITAGICLLLYEIPIIAHYVKTQAWTIFIVVAFTVLLGSILTYALSKFWLKPTTELSRAAEEISRGNFGVSVSAKGRTGQFLQLINAFNHMAEELSKIELFRDDFINYFSHEFKTPIVSIRGFAHQLELGDLDEETRAEYLRIIVEECDRLTGLASNVLLLSRFESQQIVTNPTTFSLDEQIRRALLLLEKDWERLDLELVLDMKSVSYTTNEEMLSLVWTNLIGNAIKYSRPGGRLEITLDEDEAWVYVTVGDTGIGMTEEVQARVFEKFYQGDASHKTKGNGLGLALVKRIVDLCGGFVSVTSEPGVGSTFRVLLPKTHP